MFVEPEWVCRQLLDKGPSLISSTINNQGLGLHSCRVEMERIESMEAQQSGLSRLAFPNPVISQLAMFPLLPRKTHMIFSLVLLEGLGDFLWLFCCVYLSDIQRANREMA